jgi:hypothetical protein
MSVDMDVLLATAEAQRTSVARRIGFDEPVDASEIRGVASNPADLTALREEAEVWSKRRALWAVARELPALERAHTDACAAAVARRDALLRDRDAVSSGLLAEQVKKRAELTAAANATRVDPALVARLGNARGAWADLLRILPPDVTAAHAHYEDQRHRIETRIVNAERQLVTLAARRLLARAKEELLEIGARIARRRSSPSTDPTTNHVGVEADDAARARLERDIARAESDDARAAEEQTARSLREARDQAAAEMELLRQEPSGFDLAARLLDGVPAAASTTKARKRP